MLLLLLFAFLSGFVTILAPCIWPLLPIVLSSSVAGKGHRRPLGITLGIMVSFLVFTLSVSYLVRIFHFDPDLLRIFAVIIIGILGLTMIFPPLSQIFELAVGKLSSIMGQTVPKSGSGFTGGFITGLALGIIWSPCAGPILATIAALAVTTQVNVQVILLTTAYVIGAGIPLFLFAYGGAKIVYKTRFISGYTGKIQQGFGVIMLLTALAIYTNYDKVIQTDLLNAFPEYSQYLTNFENNPAVKQQLNALKGNKNAAIIENSGLFNTNTPAPDFTGATKWLNTEKPLLLKDLKGKVVLVDFWTYTCINCIRTLPHVTKWYDKYKDQGFFVIGVHTPEFAFEKNTSNVLTAIRDDKVHYPVPQDNNYAIWNNYNNEYWPAEYLIDANGTIRRIHFGEGEYDQTEMAIQTLLREAGRKVTEKLETMPDQTPSGGISPETYLNTARMQYYYPDGSVTSGTQKFSLSENLPLNTFSYGGEWTVTDAFSEAEKNAALNYHFTADKVFLVIRPSVSNKNSRVKVFLDGKPVDSSNAGADVANGIITIDKDRLYNLIDLKGNSGEHILKLEFQTPGTQAFAFTFG